MKNTHQYYKFGLEVNDFRYLGEGLNTKIKMDKKHVIVATTTEQDAIDYADTIVPITSGRWFNRVIEVTYVERVGPYQISNCYSTDRLD